MQNRYRNYWIVSIIDSISSTSMPINEFIIYREKYRYNCRQTVIVFDKNIPLDVILPSNVDLQLVGMNIKKVKKMSKK